MHPEAQCQRHSQRLLQLGRIAGKGALYPEGGMEGTQHMVFAGQWRAKQDGKAVPCHLADEPLDAVHLGYEQGKASIQHIVNSLWGSGLAQGAASPRLPRPAR